MISRDDDLRERTNKGERDVAKRVFRTIGSEPQPQRAFAFLVKHLHSKGLVSDEDIDAMLLDAIGKRPHD